MQHSKSICSPDRQRSQPTHCKCGDGQHGERDFQRSLVVHDSNVLLIPLLRVFPVPGLFKAESAGDDSATDPA